MRRLLVAAVAALALAGTRAAPAAPFTEAFEELQTEIQARLDAGFGEVVDATEKKQQKALQKSLALLDRDSDSAIKDMKTLATIAKILEKAYPEEMAFFSSDPLGTATSAALGDLYNLYVADASPFGVTVGKMVPNAAGKKAAKFLKAASKATAGLAPDAPYSVYSKAYAKAWKSVLKGIPLTEGAALLPPPLLALNVNGTDYAGGTVEWSYNSGTRKLYVSLFHPIEDGTYRLITLSMDVDASGTAATLSGGYADFAVNYDSSLFDIMDGSLEVTTFDLPGHMFSATFSFTGFGLEEYTVTGSFTATWSLSVVTD